MPDTIPINAAIFAVVICSILFLAIGLFFNWQTEKQKVKTIVGVTKEVINYTIQTYWNEHYIRTSTAPQKVNFPPGPLAELYNEKQIEEVLTSVNKSFPDRMKAAKAAKRKA